MEAIRGALGEEENLDSAGQARFAKSVRNPVQLKWNFLGCAHKLQCEMVFNHGLIIRKRACGGLH